jgi:hypothetical protein
MRPSMSEVACVDIIYLLAILVLLLVSVGLVNALASLDERRGGERQ